MLTAHADCLRLHTPAHFLASTPCKPWHTLSVTLQHARPLWPPRQASTDRLRACMLLLLLLLPCNCRHRDTAGSTEEGAALCAWQGARHGRKGARRGGWIRHGAGVIRACGAAHGNGSTPALSSLSCLLSSNVELHEAFGLPCAGGKSRTCAPVLPACLPACLPAYLLAYLPDPPPLPTLPEPPSCPCAHVHTLSLPPYLSLWHIYGTVDYGHDPRPSLHLLALAHPLQLAAALAGTAVPHTIEIIDWGPLNRSPIWVAVRSQPDRSHKL